MSRLARNLLALPVGLPIVYFGTVVICGGFENANLLLLLSIVCTFGLGLLFWLPLCWFAGWIPLLMISRLTGPREEEPILAEVVEQPRLTRDEVAVIQYMRAAQRSGMDAIRVDEVLRQNGWDESLIRRVRELFNLV